MDDPATHARWIYMTAGSPEEAGRIGRALVAERLAACINVIPGMTAIYWWNETLQEDRETVLIAKTTAPLVDRLTARVAELHSYDCPCVVALPIVGGHAPFLGWIGSQVLGSAERPAD